MTDSGWVRQSLAAFQCSCGQCRARLRRRQPNDLWHSEAAGPHLNFRLASACSSRECRINDLRKGKMVPIRIGDHHGFDARPRGALAGVNAEHLKLGDMRINIADSQGARSLARTIRVLVSLQRRADGARRRTACCRHRRAWL